MQFYHETIKILAEIKVSEGRDGEVLSRLMQECTTCTNVTVVDVYANEVSNRAAFSLFGCPDDVLEATIHLADLALRLIDMREQKGAHPRLGALDVVSLVPIQNISTVDTIRIAQLLGSHIGNMGIPVYYYGEAASNPEREELSRIRQGEYEGLPEKLADPDWVPDEGPCTFHPKSGATTIGVRSMPLLAYDVRLALDDPSIVASIVQTLQEQFRESGVSITHHPLEHPGLWQLVVRLADYKKATPHQVIQAIEAQIAQWDGRIDGAKLIGPVPVLALEHLIRRALHLDHGVAHQLY